MKVDAIIYLRVSAPHRTGTTPMKTILLTLVLPLLGCSAQKRVLTSVEIAEDVLPFNAEQDVCRIEAKKLPKAERWDFYDKCEAEGIAKTCKRLTAAKRAAWPRCQEISQ